MGKKTLSIVLVFLAFATFVKAQSTSTLYQNYINQYATMAIDQMYRYRIPASITLAQGLLESSAGTSRLATEANNHFGIKVSSGWTGPYITKNDDHANEKFRKYDSALESYEDHSKFLQKSRYQKLYAYDVTDYKSWAKGLKECGYATNSKYPQLLINLIEQYQLYKYDTSKQTATDLAERTAPEPEYNYVPVESKEVKKVYHITRKTTSNEKTFYANHPIAENNKNYYIRVLLGDNLESISKYTGASKKRLRKMNELPDGYEPEVGTVLYLKSKRSKADKAFKNHLHTITAGQSMYDIAQMYGIKLESLYKMNGLTYDYVPVVGEQLYIYK